MDTTTNATKTSPDLHLQKMMAKLDRLHDDKLTVADEEEFEDLEIADIKTLKTSGLSLDHVEETRNGKNKKTLQMIGADPNGFSKAELNKNKSLQQTLLTASQTKKTTSLRISSSTFKASEPRWRQALRRLVYAVVPTPKELIKV